VRPGQKTARYLDALFPGPGGYHPFFQPNTDLPVEAAEHHPTANTTPSSSKTTLRRPDRRARWQHLPSGRFGRQLRLDSVRGDSRHNLLRAAGVLAGQQARPEHEDSTLRRPDHQRRGPTGPPTNADRLLHLPTHLALG